MPSMMKDIHNMIRGIICHHTSDVWTLQCTLTPLMSLMAR
jgi:hypothetical protein